METPENVAITEKCLGRKNVTFAVRNTSIMTKHLCYWLLLTATLLALAPSAYAQYAPVQEVTSTKEYKMAKTTMVSGIVVAGIGATAWLGGNVVCVIEQNRYTNAHATSGSIEEIYNLNKEAKKQPGYKTGQALEIGGYATMLLGGGLALIGGLKMKKLKNAAGETVATIDCGPSMTGLSLALRF